MRTLPIILLANLALGLTAGLAAAQERPGAGPATGAPGVVTGGSGNVSIGAMPAARDGDRTTEGGAVTGSSTNVFINGKPAVTTGDKTDCGGITVGGGGGVFINGKPAARTGDLTTGCPGK